MTNNSQIKTQNDLKTEIFCLVVVDDERSIAQCLVRDLLDFYRELPQEILRVEAAFSMDEALDLITDLTREGIKIPLVISDFAMPQGSGVELFKELRNQRNLRDTRLLLLSGQVNHETISHALAHEVIDGYLVKPYQPELLKEEVKRLVSQYFIHYHRDLVPFFPRLISHEAYQKALADTENQRLRLSQQLGMLKSTTLAPHHRSDEEVFATLTSSLKKWVESQNRSDLVRAYAPGEVILEENQVNDSLWFIIDGDACQDKQGQWGPVLLSEDSRGDLFGLLSFMSSKRSFSRVYAKTPCTIVRCNREMLEQVFNDDPDFIPQFLNTILRILKRRLLTVSETKVELQNTLQSLENAQVQLVEAEKMATIGIMTAGVAHELNNPATALERGSAHLRSCLLTLVKDWSEGHLSSPDLLSCGMRLLEGDTLVMGVSSAELREKTSAYSTQLPRSSARKKAEIELTLGQEWSTPVSRSTQTAAGIDQLYNFFEIGTFLHNIQSCSQRIANLVQGMKNYARAETTAFEQVDVPAGIEDTYWVLQNRLKHFQFEKVYHNPEKVWGVPSQLNQIWTNLLSNACDASKPGTIIKVEVQNTVARDKKYLEVKISDQGAGIAEDLRKKIFEPRFTTKKGQDGHFGLGLGLAIVKKIVTDHGGSISFDSQVGQGTTFKILLPLA